MAYPRPPSPVVVKLYRLFLWDFFLLRINPLIRKNNWVKFLPPLLPNLNYAKSESIVRVSWSHVFNNPRYGRAHKLISFIVFYTFWRPLHRMEAKTRSGTFLAASCGRAWNSQKYHFFWRPPYIFSRFWTGILHSFSSFNSLITPLFITVYAWNFK